MHRTWPNSDSTLQFFIEASLCCLQRQTRPENTQKKWTFNYNLWSWGKAEISGRCFQSSLCVLKQRISICIPPIFFSSAFFSAFSSRIILMASVRPSCHAINRFHKYPPPHVLYNCFRFLVKILVNTSDKSAELQKMRRGKKQRQRKQGWQMDHKCGGELSLWKVQQSLVFHTQHAPFFFHHSNSFSFCSWTQSICADIQCSNNLIFYPFFLNLGWIFHISMWLLCI